MTEAENEKRISDGTSLTGIKKKPKLITEFFKAANAKVNEPKTKSKLKPANATKTDTLKTNNIKVKSTETTLKETNKVEIEEGTQSIVENINKNESIDVEVKSTFDIIPESKSTKEEEYDSFCSEYNFNKEEWVNSLTAEQRDLLDLEIKHLHITWLVFLHKTLTKPYFLNLKRFLKSQSNKTVFPPQHLIYSWSHLTPLPNVKCLILGQDPYHNFNQAHGLAFSVLEPTRPPPSLLNIYKTLKIDFPDFEIPVYEKLAKQGKPGGGNLTKWAERGILMLNACLTVEAHQANSHANKGWETFTEEVIGTAIKYHTGKLGFVIMAWGTPAQNRVKKFSGPLNNNSFLVLKSVHPSPLSARRGFFDLKVFKECNQWLQKRHMERIDWGILDGNVVK